MTQLFALLLSLSLLVFSCTDFAVADGSQASEEAVSLYIENDSRNVGGPGSDQGYSNGVRVSYVAAEDKIPDWAESLFSWSDNFQQERHRSKTNFGFALAQQIYTPNNTQQVELIANDRPYAGWLYLGITANLVNSTHSHSWELDLGTVGPEALGEQVQNGFHRMIGKNYGEGWKNQLGTEATVQVFYQQRVKFWSLSNPEKKKYFDMTPYFGGGLGNVMINAHVGGLVRFGTRLPDDFGPVRASSIDGDSFLSPKPNPSALPSLYVFASARALLTARNIFLDGNTFHESHHVKKYPLGTETEFGVGSQWKKWSLIWRFVTRSPEFEEKSQFNSFASMSLTYIL